MHTVLVFQECRNEAIRAVKSFQELETGPGLVLMTVILGAQVGKIGMSLNEG
jgi:hypothetical protein